MTEWTIWALGTLLLAAGGYVVFAKGCQDGVWRQVWRLVCAAEQEITGSGRGAERKARVLAALHSRLPRWVRLFITEEDLEELIEEAVARLKELLVSPQTDDESGAGPAAHDGEAAR